VEGIEDRLRKLKGEISEAKSDEANLEGRLSEKMKRLKNEFGCSSEKEAEKLVDSLTKKKERLGGKVERGMEELEKEYSW